MNTPLTSRLLAGAALLLLLGAGRAAAQNYTQTIPLSAGWNAIHLKVTPAVNDIGVVFTNLPVESVWAYLDKTTTAEFIRNQNELPWDTAGWARYIPAPDPRSFLTTLFAVRANQAYLVRLTNAATLVVTGRPAAEPIRWVPDAFSLRGFPIDDKVPPTFEAFFAPSPAHAGQPAYRLQPDGQWIEAAPADPMSANAAYWIYTQGGSDYVAPLRVAPSFGTSLDYGSTLDETSLRIANASSELRSYEIESLGSSAPFSIQVPDATAGYRWVDIFYSGYGEILEAAGIVERRLLVRRSQLPSASYATVLSIRDERGTRHLVPVTVRANTSGGGGGAGFSPAGGSPSYTGLWVGEAVISAVSEPHSGTLVTNVSTNALLSLSRTNTSTVPKPATNAFSVRLIVHVGPGNSPVRLLKEVYQLWRDGSYISQARPDPANTNQLISLNIVDTNNPGRFVLLTDPAKLALFKGAALRDGRSVGRRISSVAFDFPDEGGNQPPRSRSMSGVFGPGGTNRVTIDIEPTSPTNPFFHRYHPDHGPSAPDTFKIGREISLGFSAQPGPGPTVPDYGYNVLDGTYQETLTGLHATHLYVQGHFRLTRISTTGELNPAP